jgi:hypothetical protein
MGGMTMKEGCKYNGQSKANFENEVEPAESGPNMAVRSAVSWQPTTPRLLSVIAQPYVNAPSFSLHKSPLPEQ